MVVMAQGVCLTQALMEGALLRGCNLSNAYLSNALMKAVDLRDSMLVGARLQGADIQGPATLYRSNCRDADFTGAPNIPPCVPLV